MALEGQLGVAVDGSAEFAFTVSNAGTEPVELRFASGMLADVAVFDDDGEAWRWSDGRAFTQALDAVTLLPGESFTHEAVWEDPDPGEYTAVGTLAASNVDAEARARFEV